VCVCVCVCVRFCKHIISLAHTRVRLGSLSFIRFRAASLTRDPRVYKSVWLRFNNLYQFAFRSLIINFYFFLYSPPPPPDAHTRPSAFYSSSSLIRSARDKFPPSLRRRPSSIYSHVQLYTETYTLIYYIGTRFSGVRSGHRSLSRRRSFVYKYNIINARARGGVCPFNQFN